MTVFQSNLNDVARFVAASLRFPTPECNGRGRFTSTIKVSQYKTKFTDVRIYCTLADPTLVQDEWNDLHDSSGEPTPGFRMACLTRDATIYRHSYLSMIDLLPEDQRSFLTNTADHRELLFRVRENLDAYLNHCAENAVKYPQYAEHHFTKYTVNNFDELHAYLCKVCGFKTE